MYFGIRKNSARNAADLTAPLEAEQRLFHAVRGPRLANSFALKTQPRCLAQIFSECVHGVRRQYSISYVKNICSFPDIVNDQ